MARHRGVVACAHDLPRVSREMSPHGRTRRQDSYRNRISTEIQRSCGAGEKRASGACDRPANFCAKEFTSGKLFDAPIPEPLSGTVISGGSSGASSPGARRSDWPGTRAIRIGPLAPRIVAVPRRAARGARVGADAARLRSSRAARADHSRNHRAHTLRPAHGPRGEH